MALALEKRLKRLQEPLTIDQVKAFVNNQMKDNRAAHEGFKTYLNSKFKEKQRDRLAAFIRIFSDKFKLQNDEVSIADHEPWPHPTNLPYPYETKGWRDIGITAELAAEVCVLTGRPCLVMHNTTLIYEHYPTDSDGERTWNKDTGPPMICFNMWGDHGFFYKRKASNGIAHKKVKVPTILRDKKLYSSTDDDLRTNFKDMIRIYNSDTHVIMEAIENKKSMDLWAEGLSYFQDSLARNHISFFPIYNDPPDSLRMISIKLPGEKTEKKDKENEKTMAKKN